MTFDLPTPPSTNSLFATDFKTKRRFISKEYAAWKKNVSDILGRYVSLPKLEKPYAVHILVNINHRSDVDGRAKAVLDALTEASLIIDDRWVNTLRVDRDPSVEGCRVELWSLAR